MSTSISLSTIQTNHINSLCKLCSNALVLVDTITLEWFRVTNIIGQLFCSINRPTIKQINDSNLFENNKHSNLVIILNQSIPISRLNDICTEQNFDSITLLTSSPSIIDDDKNELEENLYDILQIKHLQFPFISITDSFFLIPALIPHQLPTIEIVTSLTNEKIKTISLDTIFKRDEIKTIRIHAEMLNSLVASMNAREDIFILGPLSHIIAREYTQMTNIKHRRRSGENKIALLLIDRHLDLATPSSHQQDTLLAQIINILPNIRIKSSDNCYQRTIDVKIDTRALLKNSSSKYENDFNSYLFADMKRRITNEDTKSVFDNIIYSKSKVATTEVFTHLLESLIYNNLETKIKPVKVSAAAISACLEKFKQSPKVICKNYELLVISCCLMQLMDSISQNQKMERLIGLEKTELQDKDMRNQTIVAIKNIRGFPSGLFTPDEAFEYIVQMQISKFEDPVMKCVDMVVSELLSIIHESTNKMKRYPLLRQATEDLLTQYLRDREIATKQACSTYIQTQLSYINTNNEDFIGFAGAEKSVSAGETKRTVTTQVIRKGFLRVHTGVKLFQAKDYFFVLSTDNLSWFTDSDEKEKRYMLPLENLRIRDVEGGFMAKRPQFAIFNTEGKNVYKEHKTLELSVDNSEELDTWKASFLRAGVYPEREQRPEDPQAAAEVGPVDPHMERQVETINKLVTSYMQIVARMTRDYIPKTIMYHIVQNLQKFVAKELLAHLYAFPDPKSLLQESEEERQRRESKLAEFEAIKNALNIIENFQINARKVAGSAMPASVLGAGFSSFSNTTNNYGSSSNYSNNSLDASIFQPTYGFNRPPSPNPQRKQQAPTGPTSSAFPSREPPPPPLRPSPVPGSFGGNPSNLPAPIMPQPASSNKFQTNTSSNNTNNIFSELNEKLAKKVARAQSTATSSSSSSQPSSNMFHGLDPFATPTSSPLYQNGTSNPPVPARPTPSIPPRPFERPPVPQRN
ncbi:unnamed protein product [Rotaria sordida]|uniref:dynamin GTPase n=1 Tax=Rotaria sordida TaxID=392033 RepID=A0A815G9P5_9BILA|nr:unnamed protein product [Rotaria sordida]